ncbi:MAG: RNA polymerase sigma factor [Planctomycetales bacterium]|nr:RNA polymerase sigma factor [Planctomycetales bacterium]
MIVYISSGIKDSMQDSDRNLMDAYLGGNAAAFETLVRRHGPTVLGYLTKMTHNRDHAEDLFQETFRKVHEHAASFRGDNLRPWLLTLTAHTAISWYRKAKNNPAVSLNHPLCADGVHCQTLENTLPAGTPEPADLLVLDEQRRQVRNALGKLPEQQRTALVLNYYHQFSCQQIAEALNCSVGTVKTHIFRALKRMAALLPDPAGGIE